MIKKYKKFLKENFDSYIQCQDCGWSGLDPSDVYIDYCPTCGSLNIFEPNDIWSRHPQKYKKIKIKDTNDFNFKDIEDIE